MMLELSFFLVECESVMADEQLTLSELATYLGRDQRDLQKLAERGRMPGRRVGGDWQFHTSEIDQWLESQMLDYSDSELDAVVRSHTSSEVDAAVPVTSLIQIETVAIPLEGRTKRSVLEHLVEVAGRTWKIWEPAVVLNAILEREEMMSTALDNGVALPHPRLPLPDAVGEPVVAFGRLSSGIPFGAANNSLTDLLFLIVCKDSKTHLQVLARLSRMLQQPTFIDDLRAAPDDNAAYQVIVDADSAIQGQS